MSVTRWRFILFDDHKTKAHFTPASLQRALLRDLADQGHDIRAVIKPTVATGLDTSGMCHVGRPWEDFKLSGVTISFPSEAILTFRDRIARSAQRVFAGKVELPYYKIHDALRCLVLTPAQRRVLLALLTERLPIAERNARVFYADKRPVREILRTVNAKTAGIPVERMPDYSGPGDHVADRFIPRERGEA